MCLFGKSSRKRKFKKKNELSFAKTELMRITSRECMLMFSELMETEIKTGEKHQNYMRDKVAKVSKSTFKSVAEEYKHYCNYAFEDEELYRKQLKRRNKLLLWLKEYLLYTEDIERQLLRDKKSNRLDKRVLNKFFNVLRSDEKEFGLFKEFFNKYLELEKVDDVKKEEAKPAIVEQAVKIEPTKNENAVAKDNKQEEKKSAEKKQKSERRAKATGNSNDVPPGQIALSVGIQSSLKAQ